MSYLFLIRHDLNSIEFKSPDSVEKNPYKKHIIDWLGRRYDIDNYKHSFKDTWLSYNIWRGKLSISLSIHNDEEQKNLFNTLPIEIKGTKQEGTGKLVNKDTLYFNIEDIVTVNYPKILTSKIFHTDVTKELGEPDFYVYNWKLSLDDNTILLCSSQDKDIAINMEYTYPNMIQHRAFLRYIKETQGVEKNLKPNKKKR